MLDGTEIISKNFFNEAAHQFRRYLSSSTIADLESDCKKNPEDKTYMSIFYSFSKHFGKMYLIRIVFMSVALIKKKALLSNLHNHLFNVIFNSSNFKTSLFVASIPALYDFLHKFASLFLNTKSAWFTLFAGFVSAYFGISFEEKTELVKFMIMSLLARTIHSLLCLSAILTKNPPNSKLYSYLALCFICTLFNIMMYYVPDYKPITNLVNKYGLADSALKKELNHYRRINNVFG